MKRVLCRGLQLCAVGHASDGFAISHARMEVLQPGETGMDQTGRWATQPHTKPLA